MNDSLKLLIVAITFLVAYMGPIYILRVFGAFDGLEDSANKDNIFIAIGVSSFLFSLIVTYIVGNLCDGISVYRSWSNFRNGSKFILKLLWWALVLVLAGWLVFFLYSSMPFWAFVIATLLFLIYLRLGKING